MLAENVSRQDLDPIDEAIAYATRMSAYGWTVSDCAGKAGVSAVRVQFRLKLLQLRSELQALIRSGDLTLGYAQILSDANLDANFQMLAIRQLRDNATPTPQWFRRIVSDLREKQAQSTMWDITQFTQFTADCPKVHIQEPPHPSTTVAPRVGKTVHDIIEHQAGFWKTAADEWDKLGKPFKRQECEAAAFALQGALAGF
jgi:hypothetical protein